MTKPYRSLGLCIAFVCAIFYVLQYLNQQKLLPSLHTRTTQVSEHYNTDIPNLKHNEKDNRKDENDEELLEYLSETQINNVDNLGRWKNTNRSVTVVTAFFDIGNVPRGKETFRGPNEYIEWIQVFKQIQNSVVFYTDSQEFEKLFLNLRRNSTSNTKVVRLSRDSLWSFQIKPKVEKIFSDPNYPKQKPYTTVPDYTCSTHSKFPILADLAKRNVYSTEYFVWVDIGYFREIVNKKKKFWLEVPDEFDPKKIGATQIFKTHLYSRPRSIIRLHLNWLGAGIFLGTRDVILKFTEQYRKSLLRFLDQGLITVEQYMISAMYSKQELAVFPQEVEMQPFVPDKGRTITTDPWFYLGFLMYKEV